MVEAVPTLPAAQNIALRRSRLRLKRYFTGKRGHDAGCCAMRGRRAGGAFSTARSTTKLLFGSGHFSGKTISVLIVTDLSTIGSIQVRSRSTPGEAPMDDRRLLVAVTITLALAVMAFAFGFIDLLTDADLTRLRQASSPENSPNAPFSSGHYSER